MFSVKLMAAMSLAAIMSVSAICAHSSPACLHGACEAKTIVYFGARTGGPGNGIVAARFNPHTGALAKIGLVAQIERPTWLTSSPNHPVLYSVSEVGNVGNAHAAVYAFKVNSTTGQLTKLSRVDSGGGGRDIPVRCQRTIVARRQLWNGSSECGSDPARRIAVASIIDAGGFR